MYKAQSAAWLSSQHLQLGWVAIHYLNTSLIYTNFTTYDKYACCVWLLMHVAHTHIYTTFNTINPILSFHPSYQTFSTPNRRLWSLASLQFWRLTGQWKQSLYHQIVHHLYIKHACSYRIANCAIQVNTLACSMVQATYAKMLLLYSIALC